MYIIMRNSDNTVVKHPNTGKRTYLTEGAARAARSRMLLNEANYLVVSHDIYVSRYRQHIPTKTVRSLMTGEEVAIPVDTPRCCDPSTELYWSM